MKDTAKKVCKILQDNGFQAVFAGGCVRDLLLDQPFHDIDIATSATPAQVMQVFQNTVPIGEAFGVVQVHMDGFQFEVATFRTDSTGSDGRRPDSVEFSSMKEDALRRDFTINAMFLDPITEELFDFVGGKHDLEHKMLKFVGVPEDRLKEDELRALRAIRFSAKYMFYMDSPSFCALTDVDLSRISAERIKDELDKMLLIQKPSLAFKVMKYTHMLEKVLPEVHALIDSNHSSKWHPEGGPFTHTMIVLDTVREQTGDLNTLWGTLLHDIGKPSTQMLDDGDWTSHNHENVGADMVVPLLKRFKASNEQIAEVEFLVRNHMRIKKARVMRKAKLARLKANRYFDHLLLLSIADSASSGLGDKLDWVDALGRVEAYKQLPTPYVTGMDLISLGMKPSKEMGTLLKETMDKQLDGDFRSREDALRYASSVLKKSNVDIS